MNWKYYCEKILPGLFGLLLGLYLIWNSPKHQETLFGWLETKEQLEVKSAPAEPIVTEPIPTLQPKKFKPFRPVPLTVDKANSLLRAGKYEKLAIKLKLEQKYAKGADLERVTKMLAGLEKMLASQATPSSTEGY